MHVVRSIPTHPIPYVHTFMCPVHTLPSRSIAIDVTMRFGLSIPKAVVDCPASEKNSSMLPTGEVMGEEK